MRLKRFMRLLSEDGRKALVIVFVSMILSLSQAAWAQSGRRSKGTSSTAPPVATEPKTESAPTPTPKKPAPIATLIVGGDKYGTSMYLPGGYLNDALVACIDRIKESSALEAIGGGNMTRKDAMDRAKKESTSYVLWLELKIEDTSENDILINYYVFTPQTAKAFTSGRVYLGTRSASAGPIGVGIPSITKQLPLDSQMREAGREVADRIVGKFPVTKLD